jgi:hypothetical protein
LRGACHNLGNSAPKGRYFFDDGNLLKVLEAKVGAVGAAPIKKSVDHGGNALKMSGTKRSLEAQVEAIEVKFLAEYSVGVEVFALGEPHRVGGRGPQQGKVSLLVLRVGRQVFGPIELRRIHVDSH